MMDIDNATPQTGGGVEPDLKIYNVIAYIGYIESWKHAPLIFQHLHGGFTDPKEALLDLHDCLVTCVSEAMRGEKNHHYKEDFEEPNREVAQFLFDLQSSTNDDQPGGYELLENLQECGWTFQGNLVTGVSITILECAESLLANRTTISNHVDAFKGAIITHPNGPEMSTVLEMSVQIISKIPQKIRAGT